MANGRYQLHGLKLSYFTGKLEGYFRAKGVPFDFIEMDRADFLACANATGIAQMPQVQTPDGTWLTDTTAIIAQFEQTFEGPAFSPSTPVAKFFSLLLEDLFDEWLWRPALYYRWVPKEDMRLLSHQAARTILRDVNLPQRLRQQFIKSRQKKVYLDQDGVTAATAPAIEKLFHGVLEVLEPIFANRPYLLGDHPCEADFGLFGPFFRHFSHDPTPAGIMRETAPNTLLWTARLWAAQPGDFAAVPRVADLPEDLAPLIDMVAADYLPYLSANAAAYGGQAKTVSYRQGGVDWTVPVSPYRVECLNVLKSLFAALDPRDQTAAARALGEPAASLLGEPTSQLRKIPERSKPTDRLWQNGPL
ncbi:MAG: hypothetical protein Hens2KO_27580 [Henriciella sp.]